MVWRLRGIDVFDLSAVAVDEPISAEQYRCVATQAWWLANLGRSPRRYAYLAENLSWTWAPADPRRDWLLIRRLTGRREWLIGSPEEAVADGLDVADRWPSGQWKAPHGDFFAGAERRAPGPHAGNWGKPTPEFLAALPADPEQLYRRLEADSPPARWTGFVGPLKHGLSALQTGLIPADVRASLYRALLLLPGMTLEETAANVAGRSGVALVHADGHHRTEVIIEPDAGQFIGHRRTVIAENGRGLGPGMVTASTAVSVSVVDDIGIMPSSPQ